MLLQGLCRRLFSASLLCQHAQPSAEHLAGSLLPWLRHHSSSQLPDAPPKPHTGPASITQGSAVADASSRAQLMRHLQTKILMRGGPISLAEYMQEALTSPQGGFYMSGDVFGSKGHFTTSPEISQMFGEMIGAWLAHTWTACLGSPAKVLLVELGPGRGTLMADILRATAGFKAFASAVHVHLVEVSPELQASQWAALRCRVDPAAAAHQTDSQAPQARRNAPSSGLILPPDFKQSPKQQEGQGTKRGLSGFHQAPVTWHHTLDSVPRDAPALFIAHEFFDALPVHQFVKDPQRGWLEKLVDVVHPDDKAPDEGNEARQQAEAHSQEPTVKSLSQPQPKTPTSPHESSDKLRFVLSPSGTPAAALLVKRRLQSMPEDKAASIDAIEVSAHGMAVAESLALRIAEQGGAALVVDYGKDGPYADSLMAIRQHQGVPVLDEPGSADLSIWVDFDALRQAAVGNSGLPVAVSGPVTQASFLLQLGMQYRLQQLLKRASPEQAHQLESGFQRLVDDKTEKGMGNTYKVMAIYNARQPGPAGFESGRLQQP